MTVYVATSYMIYGSTEILSVHRYLHDAKAAVETIIRDEGYDGGEVHVLDPDQRAPVNARWNWDKLKWSERR